MNRRSKKEWTNPKDWIQAFNYLREYVEELSNDEKHVFFIDEMPWLDTHKSGFLPAFEYFWNDFGSSRDNLVFGAIYFISNRRISANTGNIMV